jgi:hypothetical protein
MNAVNSLVELVKKQNVVLAEQTSSFKSTLEKSLEKAVLNKSEQSVTPAFDPSALEELLSRFSGEFAEETGKSQRFFADGIKSFKDDTAKVLEQVEMSNKEVIKDSLVKLIESQTLYLKAVEQSQVKFSEEWENNKVYIYEMQTEIKAASDELVKKQSEFMELIDSLNINHVYELCERIGAEQKFIGNQNSEKIENLIKLFSLESEKSSIKYFVPIYVGVAAAVALSLMSFLLR